MDIQQNIDNDFVSLNGITAFTHKAMNTLFTIYTAGEEKDYAGQTAYEVFKEIDIIENDLSRYLPNSDVSKINNLPVGEKVIVNEHTFESLKECETLFRITGGSFNPAIGDIIQKWKTGEITDEAEESEINKEYTFPFVISENDLSVKKIGEAILDLGGFGKGFALDRAAELLTEWSIDTCLISGGYSTVLAYDYADKIEGWPVSVSNPDSNEELMNITLQNIAVSSSGLAKGSHIIDPRSDHPPDRIAAWTACKTAAWSDALSTAFMIMDMEAIEACCKDYYIDALIIDKNDMGTFTKSFGSRFKLL